MTTPKPTKEEVLAGMDAKAEEARQELEQMLSDGTLDEGSAKMVANWWERWYQAAGHKRLAYILMDKPVPRKTGGK